MLELLFNHVALPPQLPGRQDSKVEDIEEGLIARLLGASRIIRDLTNSDFRESWDCIRRSFLSCKAVNIGGKLDRKSLLSEFRGLQRKDHLILHVSQQNAGLLIRRHHDFGCENVIFEAFEASPASELVLASRNALQWDFPGRAVVIPFSVFENSSFQDELAIFLEQASVESIKRFAARTNKAGSFAYESRDTVDPSLITQMLMTLLEANGQRVVPTLLRKRVRDEVCWADGAEKPWRRCAIWLVLRVAVQRHLCTLFGDGVGRVHYKFLVCVVLTQLLNDALDVLNPEQSHFLKAKLCRRLVKLEVDRDRAPPVIHPIYEHMFTILGPLFHKTTQMATQRIEAAWDDFKKVIRRPVPYLPRYADKNDLCLKLQRSGNYLKRVLTEPVYQQGRAQPCVPYQLLVEYEESAGAAKNIHDFVKRYSSLSETETAFEESFTETPVPVEKCREQCIALSKSIVMYLKSSDGAYDSIPEQQSVRLLTVMELWTSMDKRAIKLFGILQNFNPGFSPDMLNILQLPRLEDMHRLMNIQHYLQLRMKICEGSRMTIFDGPAKGCFAERYFDESPDSNRLKELHKRIIVDGEALRKRKESEWVKLSAQYETLIRDISASTCLFTMDDTVTPAVQIHNDRQCTRCYKERVARRMQIKVYEDPLPSNLTFAKAVIFELGAPKAFLTYRDATWKILGTLAVPKNLGSMEPRVLLRDYTGLKPYIFPNACSLSLASTAKPFLTTHYAIVRFPVALESVCLPHSLRYGYFDIATKVWPGRQHRIPSFARHCQLPTPKGSPFSSLHESRNSAADAEGPSSYEIIASQGRCPPSLNVHEYMSYQSLLSGKKCLWLAMLVELSSSNLNFSSEAVSTLISYLAIQAGPGHDDSPYRSVHRVFRSKSFCDRLIEQLESRLETISSNFREIYCMDMLVTLILRLHSLAIEPVTVTEAVRLLERSRAITYNWMLLLRDEIRKASDSGNSKTCSRYAFMAALLCRRTFASHVEDNGLLSPDVLRCFIECSITLQDNLAADPSSLPHFPKTSLIRDVKIVHRIRFLLRASIEACPTALTSAIGTFWPDIDGSRTCSELTFEPHPHEWWLKLTVNADQRREQTLHYNLLQGQLLVDGKAIGKMPEQHRSSLILQELFGNQSLMTYPSGLPGMTYNLGLPAEGHEIHVGFRNGKLVVRACVWNTVLELVPREVFGSAGSESGFDLPAELVNNCIHWLDLNTGIMEIRQKPDIWKVKKLGTWSLDFNLRRAQRRNSVLVDPQSSLFCRVARIFERFEHCSQLTVYQPQNGPLYVACRRLELSFFVNSKFLLESRELQSEIDTDQDAKTWYGLNSKIVLRDMNNPRLRSIIVPLGKLASCSRNGFHVAVDLQNEGVYGRFHINSLLGRIECAAEPRLLYMKALLHAYTSSFLPDPLTRRTGTEEALHILNSGYCQPWTPLGTGPYNSLTEIARLTPKREYYPIDSRYMQKTSWDANLTVTIQYERFGPIVEAILQKSEQLAMFAFQTEKPPPLQVVSDTHLMDRNHSRRILYQRPNVYSEEHEIRADVPYEPRDRAKESQECLNVSECVTAIRDWPSKLPTATDLVGILQGWVNVGGYQGLYNKILLSDRLATEFSSEWGALVNLCRASTPDEKFRLMFLFSALSFRADIEMDIVRTLIAFSVWQELKVLDPPKWTAYLQFRENQIPHTDYLVQLMKPYAITYAGDVRSTFEFSLNAKQRRNLEALEVAHGRQVEDDCRSLAQFLLDQWPCLEPSMEHFTGQVLISVEQALEVIRGEWQRLFQNMELSAHILQVQVVLDRNRGEAQLKMLAVEVNDQGVPIDTRCRGGELPSLAHDLLRKKGPVLSKLHLASIKKIVESPSSKNSNGSNDNNSSGSKNSHGSRNNYDSKDRNIALSPEIYDLEKIIQSFTKSVSAIRKQYGQDLRKSLAAVKAFDIVPKERSVGFYKLSSDILEAQNYTKQLFDLIYEAFKADDSRVKWLDVGGLYPCVTPVTVLEQLRSTSAPVFGEMMRESLITYALSITALQRLLRIEDADLKGSLQMVSDEMQNFGHSNWEPANFQDWLLLEIDANMLIRPVQVDVALATIFPRSGKNSVLQMNMGQGKTSCILPMAAAVLANGKNLIRVIIPKPLLLQTAQLLHARLGNLLGREIRHVPFSRKTSTKQTTIMAFHTIHEQILKTSGVMLALPEHILSFNLSGLQRLSECRLQESRPMVKVQAWLNRVSRDIIDESDFTLAVRTQLIYPSGAQTAVDGHPHRWEAAETLLRLVDGHLLHLQQEFPRSIEVVRRAQGVFPMLFFLRKDVENALISLLVNDVCNGHTPIVPTKEFTKRDSSVIKQFISRPKVEKGIAERIHQMFADKASVKENIFLLRGLLVHRILLLCLKKRWNVNYGIHPGRDPVAVPFQAKGLPSEQAEFGHIDVAIILTILAFYYEGLNIRQLRQSLEHVIKSDDPASAYNRWTHTAFTLPDSLKEWNVINVDDGAQLAEIWKNVRYNTVVIDYFLNSFVFPKHAKQFLTKLQTSGWDIPLFSREASRNAASPYQALTTGFSGTNDNKLLLPLTIKQADLPGLSHTNAEVLTYLLQPRSRRYELAADSRGRHISEFEFLQKISNMGIRILIDAGAMILEMDNLSLAKMWLKVFKGPPAAIYFDKENKPYVWYRNGNQIPLLASPFAENLGECLVYIDEAHTRGTDLRLPAGARGALTLGLSQTKDHTVQAAMRLRQLATTQSVIFFAPPEVHQSILDVRKKIHGDFIDSYDVICWLLEQTCDRIEQLQPLYFSQGVDFCRRTQASYDNNEFLDDSKQREKYLVALRQIERQTLEQLYDVRGLTKSTVAAGSFSVEIGSFMKELNIRRKGFQDTGNAVHGSALQEVEQEREVAFEVEAVREVQKPVHYSPHSFAGLHKDIVNFATTGRLAAESAGYTQAFIALRRTALGIKYGIKSEATVSRLYVSTEFTKTVVLPRGRPNDSFQRQVNWILWSCDTETALIVNPEEAEKLLTLLLIPIQRPVTHLLTYAAPVTRKMLHFNTLRYFAVPNLPKTWVAPTWLKIELGIFAGRLYFEYEEYPDLCRFLGVRESAGKLEETETDETISTAEPSADQSEVEGLAAGAAEEAEINAKGQQLPSFTSKPLTFLHEWLAVRRKGQDFTHTPMGHVCQGKPLTENHPFFAKVETNVVPIAEANNLKDRQVRVGADAIPDDDGLDGDDDFDSGDNDDIDYMNRIDEMRPAQQQEPNATEVL